MNFMYHIPCFEDLGLLTCLPPYFFQTFPFFGVVAELLTEEGKIIEGEGEGYLVCIVNYITN